MGEELDPIFLLREGVPPPEGLEGRGVGWFFWDETQAYAHGPFPSRKAAESALAAYVVELG